MSVAKVSAVRGAAVHISASGQVQTVGGKAPASMVASDKQPAKIAGKQAAKRSAPVPQTASAQDAVVAAQHVCRSKAGQTSTGAVTQPAPHDSAAGMKPSVGKQSAVPKTAATASPAAALSGAAMLTVPISPSAALQPDVEGSDVRIEQSTSKAESDGTAAAGSQHGQTRGKGNKCKNQDTLSEDDRARSLYADRNFAQVGWGDAFLCMGASFCWLSCGT